ncbi:MAG TPA: type II toxin-antitoxin system PrlF family antitoxin [Dehalococcoidia bacterium]|nr:type II toxin-antitoxin system PrlF family antitoxin [Dehalococcoidia bacterium]
MKEIVTTMTQRGQVTVPAEVRRMLGLRPRDKVAFAIEEGEVRLVPARFTLESAYRSVSPLAQSVSDREMTRIAKEERARRTGKALGNR